MKDVRGDKPDTGMYVKTEKDNKLRNASIEKPRRIAAPRSVAVLDTRSFNMYEKSVCFPSS